MTAGVASTSGGTSLEFLCGGGEMGARIREYPWLQTPLGAPGTWPSGLRIALRILLTTQHPVFIFWGDELTCFYNDAYSRSLGTEKHPTILGQPGRQAWPEIWSIIGPQIDQVMRGDSATWHENALVPIIRHGELQEVYWTYSYGPIDEPGAPNGVGGVLVICTETTQQVLTERRITAERERFAQLFEQGPTFMAVMRGPDHVFELANPRYMRLVHDRPIIGRPVAVALPEIVEQGYLKLLDQVYATGKAFSAESAPYKYQSEPGGPVETRYLDFVYQPIRDANGSVTGIFVEGFDATTRALAVAELRDADRHKDEFLAMLAHELRNPLAPIRAAAELLWRRTSDDDFLHRAAEIVRRQVTQMTRLVDDLLDVSRISSGRIELRRETLELSEIIDHALETVTPLCRAKHHEISRQPCTQPLFVMGDRARLVQIFSNLITNAAKYTEPGGRITIRFDASEQEIDVEISDNGVGIAPEFMPRLFDMFAQADKTLDRSQGGLGIGLPVVKKLIDMHGGKISVRSAGLGQGSTFTISLRRAAAPSPEFAVVEESAVRARRILIVDDNADAGTSLGALLQLDGHETQIAVSPFDALKLVESFVPDVVLLDIGLPEMDGYEVARRLRASPHGTRMSIIALSGYGQATDRNRTQEVGFDAHLVKPLNIEALARLLSQSDPT